MRLTWPRWRFHTIRDALLLIAGLLGLGHETLVASEPRIALITIFAAMIGIPAALIGDRRFVSSGQATTPDSTSTPTSGDSSPTSAQADQPPEATR